MEKIKCDIALLPVSGVYVMTAEEAAEKIKSKVSIPMHYGSIVGSGLISVDLTNVFHLTSLRQINLINL